MFRKFKKAVTKTFSKRNNNNNYESKVKLKSRNTNTNLSIIERSASAPNVFNDSVEYADPIIQHQTRHNQFENVLVQNTNYLNVPSNYNYNPRVENNLNSNRTSATTATSRINSRSPRNSNNATVVQFYTSTLNDIEKKIEELDLGLDAQNMPLNDIKQLVFDDCNQDDEIGSFTINEFKLRLVELDNHFDINVLSNLPMYELILLITNSNNNFSTIPSSNTNIRPSISTTAIDQIRHRPPTPIPAYNQRSRSSTNFQFRDHDADSLDNDTDESEMIVRRNEVKLVKSKYYDMKNVTNIRHVNQKYEKKCIKNEEDLCKICSENEIDCVLLECGHMVSCLTCSSQLQSCPLCRAYIVRTIKIFKA